MPIAICATDACEAYFRRGLRIALSAGARRAQGVGSRVRSGSPAKDAAHLASVANAIKELKDGIPEGGPREAVVRALPLHPHARRRRRRARFQSPAAHAGGGRKGMSLAEFKQLLREQFFMLLLDEAGAVEAIPAMLVGSPELAVRMGATLRTADRGGGRAQQRRAAARRPNSRTCSKASLSADPGPRRPLRTRTGRARISERRRAGREGHKHAEIAVKHEIKTSDAWLTSYDPRI